MCIILPLKIMPAPTGIRAEGIFDHLEDAVEQVFHRRPIKNDDDLNQL